ncbi:MAG: hypothetical protein HOP23_16475, partial [Methylococcaceae bacterium]|nr:hypothetical protein [Methylococcaceae bacterium]
QSSGIQQVNQAIGQMDDVTQQNAALVEQAAASAESLEEQAQQLSDSVNKFYVDETSGRQSNQARPMSVKPENAAVKIETYQSKAAVPKRPLQEKVSDEWEEF